MRLLYALLIFCLLFSFGCSRTIHSTPPPPASPPQAPPPPVVSKKPAEPPPPPATSRPYVVAGKRYVPLTSSEGFSETGMASWYGKDFHGRKTANGEIYNMHGMTAAHKTLPLNTWVRVHNFENNRQIDLRLNDRGPFVTGRVIDLSYGAAQKLGIVEAGTAKVRVVALGRATAYSSKTSKPVNFEPVDYWKGNFTIQVGAFTEKNNAINLKTKLERQFKNTHIVVHKDYRGTFYRVRIMKFVNLRDAMAFSEKYSRSGRGESFVVAE